MKSNAKSRILRTADHLFYTQGYKRTGINQLIDEAQVAKASFYSHFSSKEELGKAYLQQRHQNWFKSLNRILDKYDNSVDKIYSLFEFLEEWIRETDFRGCAFINMNAEFPGDNTEINGIVQAHKKDLKKLIRNLVVEAEADGAIKKNETDDVANMIFFLFEGAIVESQNFRSLWPIEKSLKIIKTQV